MGANSSYVQVSGANRCRSFKVWSAMSSRSQLAKRAFVKVLLVLAATYGFSLHINRDSGDDAVSAAYRRVMKRVHPDKGGAVADAQRLQTAKEEWDGAKRGSAGGRRPREAPSQPDTLMVASPVRMRGFSDHRVLICALFRLILAVYSLPVAMPSLQCKALCERSPAP